LAWTANSGLEFQWPFPRIRVVGVAECGTHAIENAAIGKYSEAE
jgi:hypothetical protein